MKPITAIVLGAGQRGANVYAAYALSFPNELKIVGVAEPRADRRAAFAKEHGIPEGRCFAGWEDALRQDKFADCVFVCTQDRMHFEPVMQALEKGYDVLCEKPMSYDRTELIAMGEKARQTGRVLSICHVLRYSPFFVKLKELIDSGAIGQLVSIQHIESVGYWHMAHSFVRGNWSRSEDSCPMILAKCCHDTDILTWLAGSAWLAMGGIFLIGLGFAPMYPAMLHATPSYFGAELSQQVMGVEMAFAYVGSTCFPPLFGALAAPLGTSMYPGFLLACLLLAAAAIELADRLFSVREFCGKGEEQVI